MKAKKISELVIGPGFIKTHPDTCDCLKFGDENKEVGKIATCMFLTPEVIAAAKDWGADMVITHEPTFYNHYDDPDDEFILTRKKKELLVDANLTVYRYHDSMHFREQDEVNAEIVKRLPVTGKWDGDCRFVADTPVKVGDLAKSLYEALGLENVRIVGDAEMLTTKILINSGMRGDRSYAAFVRDDSLETVIAGELCEWSDCEPVRDAAQMGVKKAIVLLSHVETERDGMRALAERINGKFDGAEAKYFECGTPYKYLKA